MRAARVSQIPDHMERHKRWLQRDGMFGPERYARGTWLLYRHPTDLLPEHEAPCVLELMCCDSHPSSPGMAAAVTASLI